MRAFREETEQHVVHRLEAFSDIVIGFSLAQLTFNLVAPVDALDLFTKDFISLVAFVLTFFVVSAMWWLHHRLFAQYFVPTRINIVLNFASLGGVMFLVYALQLWLHARRHVDVAYGLYAGSVAWVLATIALLTYRGVLMRRDKMTAAVVHKGTWGALRMGVIAVGFAIIAGDEAVTGSISKSLNLLVVVLLVGVFVLRYVERRRRPAAAAGAPAVTP